MSEVRKTSWSWERPLSVMYTEGLESEGEPRAGSGCAPENGALRAQLTGSLALSTSIHRLRPFSSDPIV